MAVHVRWKQVVANVCGRPAVKDTDDVNALVEDLAKHAALFLVEHKTPDRHLMLYHNTTADSLCNLLYDGMERGKMICVPFYLPERSQHLVDDDKGFLTFNAFLQSNFMQLAFLFGQGSRNVAGMPCRLCVLAIKFNA